MKKLHITKEWLREIIESGEDGECEAGQSTNEPLEVIKGNSTEHRKLKDRTANQRSPIAGNEE